MYGKIPQSWTHPFPGLQEMLLKLGMCSIFVSKSFIRCRRILCILSRSTHDHTQLVWRALGKTNKCNKENKKHTACTSWYICLWQIFYCMHVDNCLSSGENDMAISCQSDSTNDNFSTINNNAVLMTALCQLLWTITFRKLRNKRARSRFMRTKGFAIAKLL